MSSGVPLLCREDEEGLREVLGRHPAVIGLKLLSCSGLIAANERQSVISGVGWVVVSPGGEVCQMASHPPPLHWQQSRCLLLLQQQQLGVSRGAHRQLSPVLRRLIHPHQAARQGQFGQCI